MDHVRTRRAGSAGSKVRGETRTAKKCDKMRVWAEELRGEEGAVVRAVKQDTMHAIVSKMKKCPGYIVRSRNH